MKIPCDILCVGWDQLMREQLFLQIQRSLAERASQTGQELHVDVRLTLSVDITSAVHLIGAMESLDIVYICNRVGRELHKMRRDVRPVARKCTMSPHAPIIVLADELSYLLADYRSHSARVLVGRLPSVIELRLMQRAAVSEVQAA